MPSLKENVRNLFPGPRMRSAFEQARQRAEDIAGVLDDVFTHRAYYLTGEQDMKAEELDSRALANLRRRSQWIPITGGQADDQDEALRRDEIVPISRRMQRWDPLTKRIVATWTDFGFGQDVLIMPEADDVKKWWSEYWTALRNRPILGARELHKLSDKTLVDGEFFFVYFTDRNTGQVTTRTIDTLEITEFITLPSDNQTVLYYKRQWQEGDLAKQKTVYYPHWLATDEQLAKADLPKDAALAQEQDNGIDKEDDTIDVDMMQVALTSQTKRGWPLMAASQDWNRAYIDFLQNRAAVARSVATYVDRVSVDGGSRAVTSFTNLLQSSLVTDPDSGETNPVPAAASMAITNKAVKWDRFNMSSGAQDAKADGAMLFNMVGIGAGLFPHWLGMGESFRLATASAMETPTLRNFERYQRFWQSVWQDMYDHVLAMAEKHGGQNFQEKGVEIALDPLLQTNLSELATAIEQVKDVPEIALPPKELTRLFLQALKIEDVEDFIAKEFPEDDAGQERAAVKVADLAAMRELIAEAANGGGPEALRMVGEAFLDSLG
ncbi:hypothetical protein LCGC14_0500260 [marine sediment metagenome]|uniref:Uncharacterized protein n=1 Tax=marine sediment metagenome TaxID=412755 RepID=A0A0F9VCN8_9ZZZZ